MDWLVTTRQQHIRKYSKCLAWPIQGLPDLRHYLHFAWKLMKASAEAFTAFMEASMEDMEAMEA